MGDTKYDAVVIGAGIIGVTLASQLSWVLLQFACGGHRTIVAI
jgi:glycine/D-amino acid oxidase-like deaminating enzyme